MLSRRLSVLLALAALPAAAAAQQTLLPYLPKDTILAIAVPDLDAALGEMSKMPLAKMWREPEVQTFVGDARQMIQQKIDEALAEARNAHKQGQLPVDPDKILQLRLHGATLAVTSMGLEKGDFGPQVSLGILMHLDFGDTAPQWFELLNMGMAMLAQQAGAQVEQRDWAVGDVKVKSMLPKMAPPGFPMGLHVAMVPKGILVGTLEAEVKAALENLAANKPQLAASEAYKTNVQRFPGKGSAVEMFMRPGPALDFMMQALEMAVEYEPDMAWLDVAGVGRAIEALGLRGVQSMRATSAYENGKAVSGSYTVVPAPDRKGIFAGANKNLDVGFLKWVPKEAVGFTAATMEPMSIYDALVAAVRAYDAKMAEGFLSQLAAMEQQVGISLRDDLFGAIGDTLITWSMPMQSIASPPETAILLKVKNGDKLVKVVKTLTQMSEGMVELEEAERRGVKTYQFRINFDPTGGMGANPLEALNPTFAFKNDFMVVGFTPSDIRRVFQRMDRTDDDPKGDIRGNKEFAAYAKSIPEAIQSLSFTDWKANFESYYQVATSLLALVPMSDDVPIDMSLLPDASTLTKHLFGSFSHSKADGNGFVETSISPFGAEVGVIIAAAIGAGAATFVAVRGSGF